MTNLLQLLAKICTHQLSPEAVKSEDWELLIPLANQHGVIPTLWSVVEPVASLLPEKSFVTLKKTATNARIEGFARKSVAKEVQDILSKHKIDTIWLKGVALAYQYYPDFWIRYMRDIDIWVHMEQADQALQCLVDHGFEIEEQERPIDFDIYLTKIHHIVKRRGVEVEIHFRLTPPVEAYFLTDNQHQWFWESTKCIPTAIGEIKVMTPTAQILHLIHHDIAHHEWNKSPDEREVRLQRKLDLHHLVQQETIDWQEVIQKATSLNLDYILHHAIKSNINLFGIEAYQDYPVEHYANLEPPVITDYKNEYAERFVRLFKNISWNGRLRLLIRAIIPTPTELKQLYNIEKNSKVATYYVLHPFIRLKDLFQMLWKQATA